MDIIGSLVIFVIFILLYMLLVEVFVMLFRITGLTAEKAKFQVVSLLTNSGYTTKESEIVVNNRKRRKLARIVMIFGYAFTVTIVSSIVNVFFQFKNTFAGGDIALIFMLLAVIIIVFFINKNRKINSIIDKTIKKIAVKFAKKSSGNDIMIIDEYGELILARVELKKMPEELKDKELSFSNIKKEHGISIILKNTANGEIVPEAHTTFEIGDTIVVIGYEKQVWEVFSM